MQSDLRNFSPAKRPLTFLLASVLCVAGCTYAQTQPAPATAPTTMPSAPVSRRSAPSTDAEQDNPVEALLRSLSTDVPSLTFRDFGASRHGASTTASYLLANVPPATPKGSHEIRRPDVVVRIDAYPTVGEAVRGLREINLRQVVPTSVDRSGDALVTRWGEGTGVSTRIGRYVIDVSARDEAKAAVEAVYDAVVHRARDRQ